MRLTAGRQTMIVFVKEMRDHLRDRRSLLLSLVYPLLGPLLLGGLLMVGGKSLRADHEAPVMHVPVQGLAALRGFADLPAFLLGHRIELQAANADAEALVRSGREPVALLVTQASGTRTIDLAVVFDPANIAMAAGAGRLATSLNEYARQRTQANLRAAGLDPGLGEPVRVRGRPISAIRDVAMLLYGMIPALLMFMVFLGGTHLAIDTTAGERERGSLVPLLTAPVARATLLPGKAAAALCFTAVTVAIHLIGFKLLLGSATWVLGGYQPPPSWASFATLFAVALPVMLFAVAMQFLIATLTRSMKEAQIYLGLLPVIPAMPGMVLAFTSISNMQSLAAWPLVGQLIGFAGLINGAAAAPAHLMLGAAGTIALAVFAFLLAIRSFERSTHLSPG